MTESRIPSSEFSNGVEKTTAFQRALEEYVAGLPERKRKREFILTCQRSTDGPINADSIFEAIKKAEEKVSKPSSKKINIRRIMRPVLAVLKDYGTLIDSLVSAYPSPAAIIWGALKVVIECADRYLTIFETIKKELDSFSVYLDQLTVYEDLYGESSALQDLLSRSYINILRFWSRVHKECGRRGITFSGTKLQDIIKDIKDDAEQIEKRAAMIKAQKDHEDRGKMELEWNAEGEERLASAEWRKQQQIDRQGDIYNKVSSWLCSQQQKSSEAREANEERYRRNEMHRMAVTCDWLFSNSKYILWLNGTLTPPNVWLRGNPGCGKSTICSHVIHSIEESDPTAAIAFRFYQFDHDESSALETLRLLAAQLFEKYSNSSQPLSEEIYQKTQKTTSSFKNVQDFIRMVIKCLPKTYFILDGLDEECIGSRWNEVQTTLEFLVELSHENPESVRLWCSSQPRAGEKLRTFRFSIIDIQDEVTDDVARYLKHELKSLEFPEREKSTVLKIMEERAEGNFLWASLMVKTLKEDASSPNEMKEFLGDIPRTLGGYYRKIFHYRFKEGPHRLLASKMFAMVAFARRPLRMGELREAIGILQSRTPAFLEDANLPFPRFLRKLSAPLIEIQEECDDLNESTCRLFHSTVRDFLLRNPDILDDGTPGTGLPNIKITPYVIFDACLSYLTQDRYRKLFSQRDNNWMDSSGLPVERHQFLSYVAKYWDKHLRDVAETGPLRTRVQDFLLSTKFQTCMQAQSMLVSGQFDVFSVYGKPETQSFLRRVFPVWFSHPCKDGNKLWKDYRAFVHEWGYFLKCGTCEDPECKLSPYTAQLDRCFWGALGPQNFMSKYDGRYTTFTFQSGQTSDLSCYDGVSNTGDELRLLKLFSHSNGTLEFTCEYWQLAGNLPPVLNKTQLIITDEKRTNWLLYVKYSGDVANMRAERACPVSFSPDCQFLRIGSQIFKTNVHGDYMSLLGHTDPSHPLYVEEFASRGPFTILASRRVVTNDDVYETGISDGKIGSIGTDFTKMEEIIFMNPLAVFIDDAGEDADNESSWSSGESSDGVYETWSERSTDESDSPFEGDLITPWTGPAEDLDGSGTDSSEAPAPEPETSSEEDPQDEGKENSESSGSEILPPVVVGYGGYRADTSSEEDWNAMEQVYKYDSDESDSAANAYAARQLKKSSSMGPHNSITVFDTSSPIPKRIFHFTRPLPFMLYGSPPIIHPSESLLVWPLDRGDILFADFLGRTFFVRRLRPSTAHTRHIFMKCNFSHCGRYLHIASLEGQGKPTRGPLKKKGEAEVPPLKLALLVVTYRLSGSKTARSPPYLIHRARIDLGTVRSLSVSRLPFTLTWTQAELYFTCSDITLRVYCVPLFRTGEDKDTAPYGHDHAVLVPEKTVFLPNTARRREVYYFPPGVGCTKARIIIASETKRRETLATAADDKFFGFQTGTSRCATDGVTGLDGMLSPPIGCYLKEADLGDWVKSEKLSKIPQDLGIGKLDRRLERFNPEDDCDLEPYIIAALSRPVKKKRIVI